MFRIAVLISICVIAGSLIYLLNRADDAPSTETNDVQTGSTDDYIEFFTLEALIRHSTVIVVAELVGSRDEKVEEIHPVTGPTGWYYDDVIRTFQAQEVLYRTPHEVPETIEDGEEFQVADSYRYLDPSGQTSIEYEMLPVMMGDTYVLFLNQRGRNSEVFWAGAGEPDFAELIGDQVTFLTTTRYQAVVRERGLQLAGDSQGPFAPSLAELRDLAHAIEKAGPLASPTPAPEPTPAKTVPAN